MNTSSIAGLVSYHPSALYQLTKHAIVALSEQLYNDLIIREANIKVSVICPWLVNTKIMDAERNRPEKYLNDQLLTTYNSEQEDLEQTFRKMTEEEMLPSVLAEIVFKAIQEDKFYIFTHPEMKTLILSRMQGIIEERNPDLNPMIDLNDR